MQAKISRLTPRWICKIQDVFFQRNHSVGGSPHGLPLQNTNAELFSQKRPHDLKIWSSLLPLCLECRGQSEELNLFLVEFFQGWT